MAILGINMSHAEAVQAPTIINVPPAYELKSEYQRYLLTVLEEYGLGKDYEILSKVITCESNFKANALHFNTNGTTDVGLFQINDIHGLSVEDRLSPQKNIEYGVKLYAEQGLAPWVCARIMGMIK